MVNSKSRTLNPKLTQRITAFHSIWILKLGFRPVITALILILVLLSGVNIPWRMEAVAEEIPRLAILPFFVEKGAVCPVSKKVFQKGEIFPGAQNTLTRLLQQKMESIGQFKVLPQEKVEASISQLERRRFEKEIIPSSLQMGKELNVEFLFVGHLFRFEERIGSSIGAEKPASVGFDLHLFRVRDRVEVWREKFDETQRPLSENLLKIGSFFRRKASWLTAGELSSVGMDEILRPLPGIEELEEKK